jgi:hypothetical protein
VQPDAPGTSISLEIACHSVGNHYIQLSERIALGRDASAARRIPARHITARSRARLNLEDDFSILAHTEKIPALETGVNRRTSQAIPRGVFWRRVGRPKWRAAGHSALVVGHVEICGYPVEQKAASRGSFPNFDTRVEYGMVTVLVVSIDLPDGIMFAV